MEQRARGKRLTKGSVGIVVSSIVVVAGLRGVACLRVSAGLSVVAVVTIVTVVLGVVAAVVAAVVATIVTAVVTTVLAILAVELVILSKKVEISNR